MFWIFICLIRGLMWFGVWRLVFICWISSVMLMNCCGWCVLVVCLLWLIGIVEIYLMVVWCELNVGWCVSCLINGFILNLLVLRGFVRILIIVFISVVRFLLVIGFRLCFFYGLILLLRVFVVFWWCLVWDWKWFCKVWEKCWCCCWCIGFLLLVWCNLVFFGLEKIDF